MFNDVSGMAGQCAGNFSGCVHDAFGASIISDVLDPVLKELSMLRSFGEEFQKLSMEVDQILQEARSLQPNGDDN